MDVTLRSARLKAFRRLEKDFPVEYKDIVEKAESGDLAGALAVADRIKNVAGVLGGVFTPTVYVPNMYTAHKFTPRLVEYFTVVGTGDGGDKIYQIQTVPDEEYAKFDDRYTIECTTIGTLRTSSVAHALFFEYASIFTDSVPVVDDDGERVFHAEGTFTRTAGKPSNGSHPDDSGVRRARPSSDDDE